MVAGQKDLAQVNWKQVAKHRVTAQDDFTKWLETG